MKNTSFEFKFLFVFMILQQVCLWVVQFLHNYDGRYLIQETFLAVTALTMVILAIVRAYRGWKSRKAQAMGTGLEAQSAQPDGTETGRRAFHLSTVEWLLIAMLVIAVASTFNAIDIESSLTGRYRRYEGLYSLAGYYLLCLAALRVRDEREKRILFREFAVIGVFSAIIGIAQGFGAFPDTFTSWGERAAIPYGNPNFYGSLICMADAVGMALTIYGTGRRQRITGGVILALGSVATFCCDSSSPLVGNIMAFLAVAVMEIWVWARDRRHRVGSTPSLFKTHMLAWAVCLAIYLAAMFTVDAARNGSVSKEIALNVEYADEGLTADKMFSNRMCIWKFIVQQLPNYWYLGTGPDNLLLITNTDTAPANIRSYDKAHNEYLNLAISEGVFALAVYLVFLFALFIPAIAHWQERTGSWVAMGLFLAFFSYIAQAFFNISVIQVAPYFWIVCGLLGAGIEIRRQGAEPEISV